MKILDNFINSEENQQKYGFESEIDSSGMRSIYYDGDINELMDIAYEASGYKRVSEYVETNDLRPQLKLIFSIDTGLLYTDSGEEIITDIDGIGDDPNFFLRFKEEGKETTIRFNMVVPKFYPDNVEPDYNLPLSSLSAINNMFELRCCELEGKWNELRPDLPIRLERLPNYRATNRI